MKRPAKTACLLLRLRGKSQEEEHHTHYYKKTANQIRHKVAMMLESPVQIENPQQESNDAENPPGYLHGALLI
jgi:hypothetical protein